MLLKPFLISFAMIIISYIIIIVVLSQITKAVKQLRANHRLILSGTPIQVSYSFNFCHSLYYIVLQIEKNTSETTCSNITVLIMWFYDISGISCEQNNVLELWSLFDFLMPGFLGTEKQFYERFGKPIIQSRDAKSSSKEQEAGQSVTMQIIQQSDWSEPLGLVNHIETD